MIACAARDGQLPPVLTTSAASTPTSANLPLRAALPPPLAGVARQPGTPRGWFQPHLLAPQAAGGLGQPPLWWKLRTTKQWPAADAREEIESIHTADAPRPASVAADGGPWQELSPGQHEGEQ